MRESASGAGVVSDVRNIGIIIDGTQAPGDYYLTSSGFPIGSLVPVSSGPGVELSLIVFGAQTRSGRIWKARVVSTTSGPNARQPTKLQWVVVQASDGVVVPKGKVVEIPFAPITSLVGNPFTLIFNEEIDFGAVNWNEGDLFGVKVTVGAPVATPPPDPDTISMMLTYECVYSQRSPLAGPTSETSR